MAEVYHSSKLIAARIAGKTSAMDAGAHRILRSVRAFAARHRVTGAYMNAFGIVTVPGLIGNGRLVDDRLVYNDDPGAAAIEWGHAVRNSQGEEVSYVPGQHIMGRGLAAVKGF